MLFFSLSQWRAVFSMYAYVQSSQPQECKRDTHGVQYNRDGTLCIYKCPLKLEELEGSTRGVTF